jgi:holo-[acyl-carrier protein] synthase
MPCEAKQPIAAHCEHRVILGLGIDICEVDRIARTIERHGSGFLKRVFTASEIEYCERYRNRFERYAGRFAAKEAAMKALGTGWRGGIRWVDFEVTRLASGQPTLALHGRAQELAARKNVAHIALSITHSGNTALAQVIFES